MSQVINKLVAINKPTDGAVIIPNLATYFKETDFHLIFVTK